MLIKGWASRMIMIRQRFSLISALAMIVTTVFATLATMRAELAYPGHQGLPFRWYWWTYLNLTAHDNPTWGYNWVELAADVFIWLSVILAVGLLVESIVRRLARRHGTTNA